MPNYDINPNKTEEQGRLPAAGISHLKTLLSLENVTNKSETQLAVSDATWTQLNLKAPLASPTFTGTVTVPTPATDDDSTKAATTAMVQARVTEAVQVVGGAVIAKNIPSDLSKYIMRVTANFGDGEVTVDLVYARSRTDSWSNDGEDSGGIDSNYPRYQIETSPNYAFLYYQSEEEVFSLFELIGDYSGQMPSEIDWSAAIKSGGATGTPTVTAAPLTPDFIGQLCRVGPYRLVSGRTQAYDWYIAETISPIKWRFMNIS
jgi:hypothetical protein